MNFKEWMRICLTQNIGMITFNFLVKKYKTPSAILAQIMSNSSYKVPGIDLIESYISRLKDIDAKCVLINSAQYPVILKETHNAPLALFMKGNLSHINKPAVAIVGARNSSINGNKIAYQFAQTLSKAGYVIVSGMARGIDSSAHLGAIQSTIAVFGCGIDIVYPAENNILYKKIIEHKSLHISEFLPGTFPAPHLFPMRNRIIAGMVKAVIVIEAKQNSGSLITVNHALDAGRDIFVVPGCPLDSRYYGSNRLIQSGAYLVQSPEDILMEYGSNISQTDQSFQHKYDFDTSQNISDIKSQVLALIGSEAVHIDQISALFPEQENLISQILSLMEIEGLIIQKHPGVYISTYQ